MARQESSVNFRGAFNRKLAHSFICDVFMHNMHRFEMPRIETKSTKRTFFSINSGDFFAKFHQQWCNSIAETKSSVKE